LPHTVFSGKFGQNVLHTPKQLSAPALLLLLMLFNETALLVTVQTTTATRWCMFTPICPVNLTTELELLGH